MHEQGKLLNQFNFECQEIPTSFALINSTEVLLPMRLENEFVLIDLQEGGRRVMPFRFVEWKYHHLDVVVFEDSGLVCVNEGEDGRRETLNGFRKQPRRAR
jgi:hypothetical protein